MYNKLWADFEKNGDVQSYLNYRKSLENTPFDDSNTIPPPKETDKTNEQ